MFNENRPLKQGDLFLSHLKVQRLAETRDKLRAEIKFLLDLRAWGLPRYDYEVDQMPDGSDN